MESVDLSGTWRAIVADEDRRRTFADVDVDDSDAAGWHELAVPGHWRSSPEFARSDGPLLTRRRFRLPVPATGRIDVESPRQDGETSRPTPESQQRWWLVLDGILYQGDVWIDGRYVGDTEGYFFPHGFDVTDLLAPGDDHVLAIEVTCAPQSDRAAKRNLTGSLQHSADTDPSWNPGGIWRGVRLERSGPLRIRHLRVRCTEASPDRAVLGLRAVIDTREPGPATLRTHVARSGDGAPTTGPVDHELTQALAAGENRVEWTVEVENPELWWPHALGAQPLYDVAVEVLPGRPDDPGAPSHRRGVRTGLRRVELRNWILHVNGERLFVKGTNLGPTTQDLASATPGDVVADITAARRLGLDLVRVHSHIARPELYEEADAVGMLVWQDLPLQWGYARSVRKQAVRQAREAVDLLAHHPSVAIWCGHDEPLTVTTTSDDHAGRAGRSSVATDLRRRLVGQVLPSWNRSILDRSIRRTLRTVDGTRPVIAHSGVLPHLPQLDGTDSHLWFGWEYGEIDDLAETAARWPRIVRFVSELGAQAVPDSAAFCQPERWPDLDWERLRAEHGLRDDLLHLVAPLSDHPTFESWRLATQRYQAELVRRQIEALRRLKYRPTGGVLQYLLADSHPAISCSVLDHDRRPKLAHDALAAACRPVIVVADPLPQPAGPRSERRRRLDIHVVSDLRVGLPGVTARAELTVGGTTLIRRWGGDVAADSCTRIGEVDADLRHAESGAVRLRLELLDSEGTTIADNEYLR